MMVFDNFRIETSLNKWQCAGCFGVFNKRTTNSCDVSVVKLKCQFCPLFSQVWQAALSALNPNPTDSCPLYLNHATVAALPSRVSRHNSPSSAHFVFRLVRSCLPGGNNRCIVVSIFIRHLFVMAFHVIVDLSLLGGLSLLHWFNSIMYQHLWEFNLGHPVEGHFVWSSGWYDFQIFFLSRWCVNVQTCLRRPVQLPGPSPSSLAAPHRHAGLRKSMSL